MRDCFEGRLVNKVNTCKPPSAEELQVLLIQLSIDD